jgi:cystathionine beta-lyase/cystathionine gamma-synthase
MRDLTQCAHHPAVSHEGFNTLAMPTYRASTIVYDDAETFAARSSRGFDGYTYGLHGTLPADVDTRRVIGRIQELPDVAVIQFRESGGRQDGRYAPSRTRGRPRSA